MAWGRRKSNSKLVENQPSLLIFPATDLFSAFSLHRGFQPPPSSSPVFSPSSPPPVSIKPSHVEVAPLLSLSLLCKYLLPCHCNQPQQQQQQKQRPTPCPETLFLPKDNQGSSSLSSHSDNSNRKLPFSFAGLCFLPLPAVTRDSHRPHHRSHTVHHRSGRQLPQCQVSLPPPFFFFLPSLLSLHVNSATWIIIQVALFRAT